MGQLLSQLGVEPAALLWQALNFLVVLVTLYYFVYRPLAVVVAERQSKIEQGLTDAKRATEELSQVEALRSVRMREAENEALGFLREAEEQAAKRAREMVAAGELRGTKILEEAHTLAQRIQEEEMHALEREATAFVQAVVAKTVELDPTAIDSALIAQAVQAVRATKHQA